MSGTFVPESDAFLVPERHSRFAFNSRPYSLSLLVVLGIAWLLDLLWVIFLLLQSEIASRDQTLADNLIVGLDSARLTWFIVNILVFLLWIYKVHQDFRRLGPRYPISPRSATIQIAIPIYGIYGLSRVYDTMKENFVPDLEILARFIPVTYIIVFAGAFSDRGLPDWAYQAIILGATTVWFISTMTVHRALATRIGEPIMPTIAADQLHSQDLSDASDSAISGEVEHGDTTSGSPGTPGEPKKRRTIVWVAAILGLVLVGACIVSFAAGLLPFLQRMSETATEMNLYDENFDQLLAALDERWGPDDSIPSASVDFSYFQQQGEEMEVWLVITLETTETCTQGATNPCEQLVDEFATIALKEYPRIDEMAGLQVSVTRTDGAGPVTFTTGADKSYSIEEWRQRLGLDEKEGSALRRSWVGSWPTSSQPDVEFFVGPSATLVTKSRYWVLG